MFREMRRFKQQLSDSDARQVLKNGHRGTLSLIGDEGYPYGLPINYFYGSDGRIYMHCAPIGHKIDAMHHCDKVSFTVIEDQSKHPKAQAGTETGVTATGQMKPAEDFALYVKSVIVFGRIAQVEDRQKVARLAMDLAMHIYPEQRDFYRSDLERNIDRVQILEITPEHISGKLVHER